MTIQLDRIRVFNGQKIIQLLHLLIKPPVVHSTTTLPLVGMHVFSLVD